MEILIGIFVIVCVFLLALLKINENVAGVMEAVQKVQTDLSDTSSMLQTLDADLQDVTGGIALLVDPQWYDALSEGDALKTFDLDRIRKKYSPRN